MCVGVATRTIAHISDLHVGRDRRADGAMAALARTLEEARVDEVLVTGDVTHGGRGEELDTWERAFGRLADRMIIVPGNHDRLGDDVARTLMPVRRVDVEVRRGLFVVRVDSTAPHNSRLLWSHGGLDDRDLAEVERAIASAPRGLLVAVMLHHHPLPLPGDHLAERVVTWLGWPHAAELARGRELVELLHGRCDLLLHGHRHAAGEVALPAVRGRPLRVVNAGCAPDLGAVRVIEHEAGRIVGERTLAFDVAAARRGVAA